MHYRVIFTFEEIVRAMYGSVRGVIERVVNCVSGVDREGAIGVGRVSC